MISQWSGFSENRATDAELLKVMNLPGDDLPDWTLNLGEWVIREKMDLSELIIAIEYVSNHIAE